MTHQFLQFNTVSNRLNWDGPNESAIYLEYVANILTEKNPSKNLSEEKNYEGKKPT